MSKRNLIFAAGIALIATLLAGCYYFGAPAKPPKSIISPPGANTIHVGIENRINCGPGYVALAKGFFGDLEIKFDVLDDWAIRQHAFLSAKVQLDVTSIDAHAISAAQNMGGMVYLILGASNGADGIVVKPDIKTAADLKGKKIAYARATPSHFFLVRYLKQNGISMDDIERLEVDDPAKAADALAAGNVDAAVTSEPAMSQIVKSGKSGLLVTSASFPNPIVDIMLASSDMLEHRKADLQKFTTGWLQAVEYMKTHPPETNAILAKNFKVDEKEIADMAARYTLADLATNMEWLLPSGNSRAIELFDDASSSWVDEKVISNPRPGKFRFTTDFIENIRPETLLPPSSAPVQK